VSHHIAASIYYINFLIYLLIAWAAKYKIFSQEKKQRIVKYEDNAKQAFDQSNFIKASRLYEGLSKECPSFDNYYMLAICLIKSKSDHELSHMESHINSVLFNAYEYAETLGDRMKVDELRKIIKSKVLSATGKLFLFDLEIAPVYLILINLAVPAQQLAGLSIKDDMQTKEAFESALKRLDQPLAVHWILKEKIAVNDRYKRYFNDPKAKSFVQHLTEQCCMKNSDWALWFTKNFSHFLRESSLLRIAVDNSQRTVVDQLLTLDLTFDINDGREISKESNNIIHLAAKRDFPNVIMHCFNRNSNNINIRNQDGESPFDICCKYGSINSFDKLLELHAIINNGRVHPLKILIDNISQQDVETRMKMMQKIINRDSGLFNNDKMNIIDCILKKQNVDWLEAVFNMLTPTVVEKQLNSDTLLLIDFFRDLSNWDFNDESDVAKVIQLMKIKNENMKGLAQEIMTELLRNFNSDIDSPDIIASAFLELKILYPTIDFVNNKNPNPLELFVEDEFIDTEHLDNVSLFFKCLNSIGFYQWATTTDLNIKILKKLYNCCSLSQKTMNESVQWFPESFRSSLAVELMKSGHHLLRESQAFANAIFNKK
jgi:hypothetical protein